MHSPNLSFNLSARPSNGRSSSSSEDMVEGNSTEASVSPFPLLSDGSASSIDSSWAGSVRSALGPKSDPSSVRSMTADPTIANFVMGAEAGASRASLRTCGLKSSEDSVPETFPGISSEHAAALSGSAGASGVDAVEGELTSSDDSFANKACSSKTAGLSDGCGSTTSWGCHPTLSSSCVGRQGWVRQ